MLDNSAELCHTMFIQDTEVMQLYDNRNMWYDSLNDVHEHSKPDAFGDSHCSRFNQYFYAYLTCINEFNDDETVEFQHGYTFARVN